MASPTDKFDEEALPDPELNPLLNPVLSAHMGRWAEVYFTSPPEKRGQAVSELLRELKNDSALESASPQSADEGKREDEERPRRGTRSTEKQAEPPAVTLQSQRICSVCSSSNTAEHKFCGMCGAPLQFPAQTSESNFHRAEPAFQTHSSYAESSAENYSAGYATERSRSSDDYGHHDNDEPEWQISETDLPHFAMEPESVPYRFRLYIGVAVAVLLAALVYVKWHGMPGSSSDGSDSAPSRVIPAAPAPVAPASTPGAAATRSVLPTEGNSAAHAAPPVENQKQPEPNPVKEPARDARATSPRVTSTGGESSPAANEQDGGGEELATADRYLDSSSRSGARDNRQAAQWLWKAVGKGNVTATLVLSDLYLRGDGVPKSCDQARLLLDAAARKGKAAAAQRLRNLQAFGCQ